MVAFNEKQNSSLFNKIPALSFSRYFRATKKLRAIYNAKPGGTFTGRAIIQDAVEFYFRLRHWCTEDENPRKSFRDAGISIFISII